MTTVEKMLDIGIKDENLVAESLAGDREAFGRIVARYQSLVCSLAYSATGSLTQSEDLAQEIFVAAWRRLRSLREPAKLRSWLCGITRNHICDALKRRGREPSHAAEPLETVHESPAIDSLPTDQIITREEQAILWRSIERLPATYREPLILYYREHKSIETVAAALELSEDAVKQRLSRGRNLVHEEVLAFVEGALARSNPGKAFTLGVLAALPLFATSAKAAGVAAAAAKGSTVAKSASVLAWAGAILLGPVVGLLGAWLGTRVSIESASSARERRFMVRASKITWAYTLAFNLVIFALIYLSTRSGPSRGLFWTLVFTAVSLIFVAGLLTLIFWTNRNQRRIHAEEQQKLPQAVQPAPGPSLDWVEYRSKASLLGLPLLHICGGRGPDGKVKAAKGWIAIGGLAYGALFSCGGIAIGGISIGGIAIGVVAIGGFGFGLLALAGFAAGFWAAGGAAALGYFALSGTYAVAWMAAHGSPAVAHHFAVSKGVAMAHHANDPVAKAFIENHPFFLLTDPKIFSSALALCWLPMLLLIWQISRIRAKLRHQAAADAGSAQRTDGGSF